MYSHLCPLSERYVFDILTFTFEMGSIMATDLQSIATNYRTVSRTASELVSIGLMDVTIVDDGRLKKIYRLTPKGERVAMHLMQAKLEFEETVIDRGNPEQKE